MPGYVYEPTALEKLLKKPAFDTFFIIIITLNLYLLATDNTTVVSYNFLFSCACIFFTCSFLNYKFVCLSYVFTP